MKVSANITRRDLLVVSSKMRFRARAHLYFMLVLGCGIFAYQWFEDGFTSASAVAIAAFASAVGAAVGLFVGVLVNTACLLLMANERSGVLGMHHFSLSPVGLSEATDVNQSKHSWPGIRTVMQLRRYVVILNHAYAAHLIPRRAFASHEEFNAFFAHARARWKAAHTFPVAGADRRGADQKLGAALPTQSKTGRG